MSFYAKFKARTLIFKYILVMCWARHDMKYKGFSSEVSEMKSVQ